MDLSFLLESLPHINYAVFLVDDLMIAFAIATGASTLTNVLGQWGMARRANKQYEEGKQLLYGAGMSLQDSIDWRREAMANVGNAIFGNQPFSTPTSAPFVSQDTWQKSSTPSYYKYGDKVIPASGKSEVDSWFSEREKANQHMYKQRGLHRFAHWIGNNWKYASSKNPLNKY